MRQSETAATKTRYPVDTGFWVRERLLSSPVIRYPLILRGLITAIVMLSWSISTSHCALVAATATIITQSAVAPDSESGCPMHAKKAAAPQPEKKGGCRELPCCKNLPAAKPANSQWNYKPLVWLEPAFYLPVALDLLAPKARPIVRLRLDTGPPGPDKFLELTLQRSIPAHGPPLRLI